MFIQKNVTVHEYTVKGIINPVAHFYKGGNTKVGNAWTFSTLNKGDDDLYIIRDEAGNTYVIKGTCSHYCKGCRKACYVNKSYWRKSVVRCHAENTLALSIDTRKAFEDLRGQIQRAIKKPVYIRFNQSGEIVNLEFLVELIKLAKAFPNIKFWLYTKAYDLLEQVVSDIPSNLFVNISIWHEFGIEEFKRMSKRSKQIAAFVYCDGFDYEKFGLVIRVMCPAYDKRGKLNHDKPCSKCGLCMRGYGLVIGCYDH